MSQRTVQQSHGLPRAETPRARELPDTPSTALTASDRDPHTGRFRRGNQASRRRRAKQLARQLPWLDPERCAEWARPYIGAAREHAESLLAEAGGTGSMISPMAEELATARLVYRALLQLGLAGDLDALESARKWLQQARQHALTLEHALRAQAAEGPDSSAQELHARILAAGTTSEGDR